MKKVKVGVLGATGLVGQRYVQLLQNHPWFELSFLAASQKSVANNYQEAIAHRWRLPGPIPNNVAKLPVFAADDIKNASDNCEMVFSALDATIGRELEPIYAKRGFPVFSNAASFRNESDVPVIIPEINLDHSNLIQEQKKHRGYEKGFIVCKPNCSVQSFMIPLTPIREKFGLKKIHVTTLQSISGAGIPGVSALDALDNVIPYIHGEVEKTEGEPKKIWGTLVDGAIKHDKSLLISAQCNRVPVQDGHLACVSVELEKSAKSEELLKVWQEWRPETQILNLPSAPEQIIQYNSEVNRPQPRLDRDSGGGMAVSVGRLEKCPILNFRFVALSHNTIRGAAGGAILCAEALKAKGLFS